jgi:hypothetical protein
VDPEIIKREGALQKGGPITKIGGDTYFGSQILSFTNIWW